MRPIEKAIERIMSALVLLLAGLCFFAVCFLLFSLGVL